MKLCIEHGVPVLCEKPFTVNYKEAEEVIALAKEKGVYVSEAMWTWHNKTAHKVREWLAAGKVGKVESVSATYSFPLLKLYRNPRLTSSAMIGGALMDIGVYPVRYMLELFGMPQSISCKGDILGDVDVAENIVMDYGNFKAVLTVSMVKMQGEKLVIKGTDGSISVPFYHMAKKAVFNGHKKEKFKDKSSLYAVQTRHVADEIRSGKKQSEFVPFKATLDTMQLLDECRRQMNVIYPSEKEGR